MNKPSRAQTDLSGTLAAIIMLLIALAVVSVARVSVARASESENLAEDASEEVVESSVGSMIIVVGAPGTDEYARSFFEWSDRWKAAATEGDVSVRLIDRASEDLSQLDELKAAIASEKDGSQRPLWLIMIGHGTFDGRQAKFNLNGPDVTAEQLADWLPQVERPLAIINCASASAPFIDRLSGPNRIVVTGTKAGGEVNFTRFGDYLSQAIGDQAADLDKDGQVSLLEAFLMASRKTQTYYDGLRQLATEHALLDDNGDARGVRADFFSGIQPDTTADGGETLDGPRAHQWHLVPSEDERRLPPEMRRRRDELELELAEVRDQRAQFSEAEYYQQIEPLLIEIARLYQSADSQAESAEPE